MLSETQVFMAKAVIKEYNEIIGFDCSKKTRLRNFVEARAALFDVMSHKIGRREFSTAFDMDRTTTYNIERNMETYKRFSREFPAYHESALAAMNKVNQCL
jgi:hypothetical protein